MVFTLNALGVINDHEDAAGWPLQATRKGKDNDKIESNFKLMSKHFVAQEKCYCSALGIDRC